MRTYFKKSSTKYYILFGLLFLVFYLGFSFNYAEAHCTIFGGCHEDNNPAINTNSNTDSSCNGPCNDPCEARTFKWGGFFCSEDSMPNNVNPVCGNVIIPDPPPPPPIPTASLTCSPSSIMPGGSATVSWSCTNSNLTTGINFSPDGRSRNGSMSVSPTSDTTYTLTCRSGEGAVIARDSCSVGVSNANISCVPSYIEQGESATVSWSCVNFDSSTGTNFSTGGNIQGSVSVSPTSDTTYSVECTGNSGAQQNSSSASCDVNLGPDPCTQPNPPASCGSDSCNGPNPPASCGSNPCSGPNPPASCGSDSCTSYSCTVTNDCGQTNTGSYETCSDGSSTACNAISPPNPSGVCSETTNCGDVDGFIGCNGLCNIPYNPSDVCPPPPPPCEALGNCPKPGDITSNILASPTLVARNATSTISWFSTETKSCSVTSSASNEEWLGIRDWKPVTILEETTFTLRCIAYDDSVVPPESVTVRLAPRWQEI